MKMYVSLSKKIPGIRGHHCFSSNVNGELCMYRISADTTLTLIWEPNELSSMHQYVPGQYIAAVYDQKWYTGRIVECD